MRSVLLLSLFMLCFAVARSQLCSGSLGDPVASITFGAGISSQGGALPPGKTNYEFATGCPNDGFYNITNLSFACFGQTWHTLVGDHTPNDVGGYYMLVNASNAPGIFYTDTVYNLCGNTTYEFSAYVVNMLKSSACSGGGIEPDLTFIIETVSGNRLATYPTGKIPSTEFPEWKQFGTFLRTPATVDAVVIKLVNNAPGGCGNDLAIDDIQFRPCGPRIEAGIGGIGPTVVSETNFCEGDTRSFTISATYSDGYTNPRLQWQVNRDNTGWVNIPGATGLNYTRAATGRGSFRYRVLIADGANAFNTCGIASQPVTINVAAPPSIQATNYVFGCLGSRVPFFASGARTYQWSGPNGFSSSLQDPEIPVVQFRDSGLYIVRGITPEGCEARDSTYLQVFVNAQAQVPQDSYTVCEGRPLTISATGGERYRWQPSPQLNIDSIANPTITAPRESTRFQVTVINRWGCTDTASVQVNVLKLPKADAGPDIKMLKGRPVQLRSSISGTAVDFSWTPTTDMLNPNAVRPTVNPLSDTRYRLTVISPDGCGSSSDEVEVKVFEKLRIPNTFTPNGDGYNDKWQIELLDQFTESVTEVFNTAGQLVYRDIGHGRPWDGTRNGNPVPAGTYYYVIDLKTNADKLTGYVTVIR